MKFIFIIFLFVVNYLQAQDIHFSQSHLSPLNLNPSETGRFNGDYRAHFNERTQWRSITVPYVTFSASFEKKFNKLNLPGNISTGLIFNQDKAGDGHFGTSQIGLSSSYLLPMIDSTWEISIGILGTWNQNSVDYTKFYFDNQYNGYMYDPTINPLEQFPRNQIHYFDIHSGLWIKKWLKPTTPLIIGMAVYHINQPKKTFYQEIDVKLDRKMTLYAHSSFPISQQIFFLPSVYWFNQKMLNEIYIGGLFYRKTQDYSFKGFYLGGWFRLGDAAILSTAIDYQSFHIGLSYDFNISPLVTASNGRGGIEIAIRYIFSNPTKIQLPEKHICPTFL
ncbi:MAG: PorP/SprF family type IX secretion system membrane protein [Bacteroidales bacterium]